MLLIPLGMTPTDPKGRPTLAAAEAERATRDQAVTYQGRHTAAQTQAQTQTETQTQSSEANVEDASTLAQRFALLATQPRATRCVLRTDSVVYQVIIVL